MPVGESKSSSIISDPQRNDVLVVRRSASDRQVGHRQDDCGNNNSTLKGKQMSDPTETVRREMVEQINAIEGSREYLQAKHGAIWDTTELQEQFEVTGFIGRMPNFA